MAKYTYVTDTVTPEQAEKWARKRRNRHHIADLPDGFAFLADGRAGFIYYREHGKILELMWEMSGVPEYDILLNTFGLRSWVWPEKQPVSEEDRVRIRAALVEWLARANYRAELSEVPF